MDSSITLQNVTFFLIFIEITKHCRITFCYFWPLSHKTSYFTCLYFSGEQESPSRESEAIRAKLMSCAVLSDGSSDYDGDISSNDDTEYEHGCRRRRCHKIRSYGKDRKQKFSRKHNVRITKSGEMSYAADISSDNETEQDHNSGGSRISHVGGRGPVRGSVDP